MKAPTFRQWQKPVAFIFGMAMAAFEIVKSGLERPGILVFLAMCMGIIPAGRVDGLIKKAGGLKGLLADPPAQPPVPDPDPVREPT